MKSDRLVDVSENATEQLLLRAAKSERLSDDGRQRILASFGVMRLPPPSIPARADAAPVSDAPAAHVAGPTGATSVAKLAVGHAVSVKWIGLCVLALVPIAAVMVRSAAKPIAPSVARADAPPVAAVLPAAPPPAEVSSAEPEARAPSAALRDEAGAIAAHGAAANSLQQEVAALQVARGALDHGDAAAAVRALERHRRTFPQPQLAPEAMALRVEALALRGDVGAARALADRFDAAYPQSPYRARLRTIVHAGH